MRRCSDRVERPGGFVLDAPRTNEKTGAKVFTAVLAVPGVHSYPWGEVLTAPEVLADESFLRSLEGIPVVDDDGRDHQQGVTVDEIDRRAVGTVTAAWWDDEQQALLGRLVIDRRRGLDQIADGRVGVSIAYDTDVIKEAGEWGGKAYTHRQIARRDPHNLAITHNPRHIVSRIQADATTGDDMDPKALLDAFCKAQTPDDVRKALADAKPADSEGMGGILAMLLERLLASEAGRMEADAKYADMCKQMDAMKGGAGDEAAAPEAEGDADADEEKEPPIQAVADALALATRYGVKVDGTTTLTSLRRAVAKAAGVKAADSLATDALVAVLDTLPAVVATADAWDRAASGAKRTTTADAPRGVDFTA